MLQAQHCHLETVTADKSNNKSATKARIIKFYLY